MNEFAKEKIAFVIGLLAVLFTLTPLLDSYGTVGFPLMGIDLTIQRLYLLLAGALSVAVYCYGIQFLTERRLRLAILGGDAFYAIAMVAPALFLVLFSISQLAAALEPFLKSDKLPLLLQNLFSIAAGVASGLAAWKARATLARKQQRAETRRREVLEVSVLARAEELLRAGHADLAVVEAFKALEIAARGQPALWSSTGSRPKSNDWHRGLRAILPQELQIRFDELRRIRNEAAHSARSLSAAEGRDGLDAVNKILALLSSGSTADCPECGSSDVVDESGSDHGYAWSRRRCRKCGWLDLG